MTGRSAEHASRSYFSSTNFPCAYHRQAGSGRCCVLVDSSLSGSAQPFGK
ncbi:hypothetical protein [Burkholderia glumae]|nr:hypothetical protein [Burkholderia glumae]